MNTDELHALTALITRWEDIADRLENQPVVMTANTHRLFANELRAELFRLIIDSYKV